MGAGTEGTGGTRLDCLAGPRSTTTLGECMLTVGILIGASAARFRDAWPIGGFGGTGGGGRDSSGIDVGIGGGSSLGVMGVGELDDLEGFRKSRREAEGEMSRTSSAA